MVQGPVLLRSQPPFSEALGDDKCELQRLGSIEPGVAVGVVARAQVVKGYSPRPSYALCYVLARHLEMDPSWMATFLLVHVEEGSHLRLIITTIK